MLRASDIDYLLYFLQVFNLIYFIILNIWCAKHYASHWEFSRSQDRWEFALKELIILLREIDGKKRNLEYLEYYLYIYFAYMSVSPY